MRLVTKQIEKELDTHVYQPCAQAPSVDIFCEFLEKDPDTNIVQIDSVNRKKWQIFAELKYGGGHLFTGSTEDVINEVLEG